jgi:hypothetical protein
LESKDIVKRKRKLKTDMDIDEEDYSSDSSQEVE